MEGFKESVAKILEGIKAFFAKIGDALKALWDKLFDLATKTAARAEKMAKNVKEAQDDKLVAGDSKLKVNKYLVAFNVASGDVAAAAAKVIGGHQTIAGKLAGVNSKLSGNLDAVTKADSVEGITLTDADFGEIAKGELAFGYTAEVKEGALTLVQKQVNVTGVVEEAPADLQKLASLTGAVKAFAGSVIANKDSFAKAQDVVKKAIALADKLAKNEESAEQAKEKAKSFRNVQASLIAVNKTIPVLGLKAGVLALDFVGANLKAYGTK